MTEDKSTAADNAFQRVLQYFLLAKTRLQNDVYLETLLTHLKAGL